VEQTKNTSEASNIHIFSVQNSCSWICVLCDDDSDGLHLTAGGNRIVFDELVNVLNGISFLRADKLPMDFPPFSDIDPKNPGVAFQTWKNNANLVCF
jgi:hypothetical protein